GILDVSIMPCCGIGCANDSIAMPVFPRYERVKTRLHQAQGKDGAHTGSQRCGIIGIGGLIKQEDALTAGGITTPQDRSQVARVLNRLKGHPIASRGESDLVKWLPTLRDYGGDPLRTVLLRQALKGFWTDKEDGDASSGLLQSHQFLSMRTLQQLWRYNELTNAIRNA